MTYVTLSPVAIRAAPTQYWAWPMRRVSAPLFTNGMEEGREKAMVPCSLVTASYNGCGEGHGLTTN